MKLLQNNIKPILALLIVLLGFAYIFITTLLKIEPNEQAFIAVFGLMTMATGYYFGASTGTAKKDEIISDLSKNNK